MELTHLRYFWNVAAAASFVDGAKRSHVSPPAITKAVQKLEAELGVELFARTTRRVALTEAGELLRARCRRILDEVDAIQRDLDEGSGAVAGELRIGAMEVFSIHLLPTALSRLVRQHPGLVPLSYELVPQRMSEAVAEGRLDVGFTIGATAAKGLERTLLAESPGTLVCGRGHALHGSPRVGARDLQTFPSVVPRFLGLEHLPVLDQFPEEQYPRRVGASISLLQMGLQLALGGTYLGYFPEIVVRPYLEDGRLWALRGLRGCVPFALTALTRQGVHPKRAVRLLMDELRTLTEAPRRRRPARASTASG